MEKWRTFSLLFTKILLGLPEVKCGAISGWDSRHFHLSSYSTLNLQQLINYCLCFPTSPWLLAVSAPKLWFSVFTHLSRVQGSILPCDLNSLRDLINVINFPFVQPFPCEDWRNDFHAVYMSDQKTRVDFFFFYISHGTVIEEDWFIFWKVVVSVSLIKFWHLRGHHGPRVPKLFQAYSFLLLIP